MHEADELVAHMDRVLAAKSDLRDLGVVWQMIESSAAISCPEEADGVLPTLIRTRERFDGLQGQLVGEMVGENRAALGGHLSAKAQCAIDILVRNLYERTADVGFLSTDDVVRAFCAASAAEQQARRDAMVARLREYQAKYSVYDDVVLLSTTGAVLARLDTGRALAATTDSLVSEALAAGGYIERFRATDLSATSAPALLYAHRIVSAGGQPVGVLVLRFRFIDEMKHVFAGMADERQEVALVLLDADHQVIASNDEAHVAIGARLKPVAVGAVALTSFAGREYLAVACASPGYQGYAGPPWRAQAMVSLLTAFRTVGEGQGDDAQAVPIENPSLKAINDNADAINRDLRRVVWNGQLQASTQQGTSRRLKALLNQVNQAGRRMRERVGVAIRDLHGTSLARASRQVGDLARLAADFMDRNLYERANDCRWWALSPALRRLLSAPADAGNANELNRLLDHINALYTVYSRLVVFDASGQIRGVSHSETATGLLGSAIDPTWLTAAGNLRDSQSYHVSAFEPTGLHDQGATYVYIAAVRGDDSTRTWLGGIAIVFNAARELKAMLHDVLGDRQGVAAFVDASGKVLAATDETLAAGLWPLLARGDGIATHGEAHFSGARSRAAGYREFKTSDGYDNQVQAMVALRLGAAERRETSLGDSPLRAVALPGPADTLEVAVFQVGAMRCALPARSIVESVSPERLNRMPLEMAPTVGLLEISVDGKPLIIPVMSARQQLGVNYPSRESDGVVLVLRHPDATRPPLGLLIDDVLAVLEVERRSLHPAPLGFTAFMPWLSGVLDVESPAGDQSASVLLLLLDPERILADASRSLVDMDVAQDSAVDAEVLTAEADATA